MIVTIRQGYLFLKNLIEREKEYRISGKIQLPYIGVDKDAGERKTAG